MSYFDRRDRRTYGRRLGKKGLKSSRGRSQHGFVGDVSKRPLIPAEQTDRTKVTIGIPHVAQIEKEQITKKMPEDVPPSVKRRMTA